MKPSFIRSKLFILALIVLAGLGAGAYWYTNSNQEQPRYKFAKIESGPLTAVVAATGTLNPVVSVQVGSQVSGQIKEILVDFNTPVKAGQLIARLDPETYQLRVSQAEADLDASRAAIAVQRAQVARSQATLDDARRDLDRKQQLLDKKFISTAERDKAQTNFDLAKADLQVSEAQMHNSQASQRQRESQLAQAKVDLERTAIRSPVDGIVVKRSVDTGQTVAASLQAPELFIIAKNLSDMQVETAIDEADIGRIRLGQKATFTVDAFTGRTFEGSVMQIRKAAQVTSNVVSYTVIISAANPELILLPGMTANARIVVAQKDKVLKVMNAALRFRPAGSSDDKLASTPPSGPAGATVGSGQGGGQQQMRDRLVKELKLDADQQGKLDAIYAGQREKFTATRALPEAERAKAQERNRAELREKISAILTPEQQRDYAAIMASQAGSRSGNVGGKVWVLDADGKPKGLSVKLGINDGSMTELVAGSAAELVEGAEVIIGTSSTGSTGNAKPATPAGPRFP